MTWAEIRAEIFRRLEENAVTPDFHDVSINALITEAYGDFSALSEWNEVNQDVTLINGTTYYDLLNTLTIEPLTVRSVYNNQIKRFMNPTTYQELDHNIDRWEFPTGNPQWFFIRGVWHLGVFPKPPTTGSPGSVKVFFKAVPAPPSLPADDALSPGFDHDFHEALVFYCLSDMLEDDRETGKALKYYGLYRKLVAKMRKRALEGHNQPDLTRYVGD